MNKLLNFIDSNEDPSAPEVLMADYILRNIERIPSMTIYELAESCHTSPATLSRFSRKLGNTSFKEFKESCLSVSEYKGKEINYNSINHVDEAIDIEKNFSRMIDSLIETKELMNSTDLTKTAKILKDSQKIAFFGTGYSYFLARNAHYKFTRLGKYCSAYSNFENQLKEAKSLTSKDVGFIISFSGETSFIIKLKKIMQRRNIKLITLTSEPHSHSAKGADVILQVSSIRNENFNSPVLQELAMISLINVIYLAFIGQILEGTGD